MSDEPLRFELDRLSSYDADDLVAELQRVAALEPDGPLTEAKFEKHAKVHGSTIRRRLGGWREGLIAAGLEDRYSGRTVSKRMRDQPARGATKDEMVDELQRVARSLNSSSLSREQFRSDTRAITDSAIARRFGSWRAALDAAGLNSVPAGRRWTDEDYFENLLAVWTFHGRRPVHREMNEPPSRITAGGYEHRFGTWRKALVAFVERMNADAAYVRTAEPAPVRTAPPSPVPTVKAEDTRSIPIGLRYDVLRRDHFRCVICGRSPATHHGLVLHVDHVLPMARGGKTRSENLRTLCHDCNIGKGSKLESPIDRDESS